MTPTVIVWVVYNETEDNVAAVFSTRTRAQNAITVMQREDKIRFGYRLTYTIRGPYVIDPISSE